MNASDMRRPRLLVILVAAVLQGWALYGLQRAMQAHSWPATQPAWLFALYALWAYVPLTVELLAVHARQRAAWLLVSMLAVAFFGIGWHYGAAIAPPLGEHGWDGPPVEAIFPLTVLWLLVLPFMQNRLANGHWRSPYADYFSTAWHNKLRLAEGVLFTGAFWLLLALWAGLFKLLHIDFFKELFTDPVFVYPVTALAFGIALHLIGMQQRLVTVVLEQLLGLLKWLALLAALILLLFTLTLLPKLSQLFGAGQRAVDAYWLLGLVAVMVLLLNAAYRDGSVAQPYPRPLALALRIVAPLLVVIAAVALYALGLRIGEFGLTVARAWGLLVAVAALAYAAGYTWAAVRPGDWMAAMGRLNIAVALGLIALIFLMLTPVLSPSRLAAASQYRVALANVDDHRIEEALRYLRWEAGRYGARRLDRIADLKDHPRAAELGRRVARIESMQSRWDTAQVIDAEQLAAGLPIFPAGRTLDAALRTALLSADGFGSKSGGMPALCREPSHPCAGLYVDLDADGREEFVLLAQYSAVVYGLGSAGWQYIAVAPTSGTATMEETLAALRNGDFAVQAPRWQALRIGTRELHPLDLPADAAGARPPR